MYLVWTPDREISMQVSYHELMLAYQHGLVVESEPINMGRGIWDLGYYCPTEDCWNELTGYLQ
jgi:hypothetical protein